MMDIELAPTIVRQPLPLEPIDPVEFRVLLSERQDCTDMKKPWVEGQSTGSLDRSESRLSEREHFCRPYSELDQGRKGFRRAATGKSSLSSRGAPSDSSRPYSVLDVSKWQGSSGDTRTEVVDMLRKLQVEVDTLREFLDERKRTRESGIYESIETKTFPRTRKTSNGDSLLRYASTMGLHRLRYLIDSNAGACRRFCWATLFVCCIGLATFQIQDRIRIFLSYASDTTVETKYMEAIQFPAVTICNLNKYRLTPTANRGLYEVLHNYVHGRGLELEGMREKLEEMKSTYADFLRLTAHQKEKLVYSCRFRNSRCSAEDFRPTFTDHGLCYTFTLKYDRSSFVRKAGPESGLSLLLNVEQYEYLLGPKSAVGIKVAVHDPSMLPSMKADSLHASVGSRSSLAIAKVKFQDLSVPYGLCVPMEDNKNREFEPKLPCSLQCENEFAIQKCNCTLYQTEEVGDKPMCSIEAVFLCLNHVAGKRQPSRNCSCQPSCDRTEFDVQLSHAMMSAYSAESEVRMLHDHSALQREFRTARDIYQRLDEEIYKYDLMILTNLSDGLRSSLDYMKNLKQDMNNYDDGFDQDLAEMKTALNTLNETVQGTFSQFDKSTHVSFMTFAHQLKPPLEEITQYENLAENLHTHSAPVIRQKLREILSVLEKLTLQSTSSLPVTSEITKGVNSFRDEILHGYGQKYREFRDSRMHYEITTQKLLNFTNYIKDSLWEQYKFIKNATQKSDFQFTRVKRRLIEFFRVIRQLKNKNVPELEQYLNQFFNLYVSHRTQVTTLISQMNEIGAEFTTAADVVKRSSSQLRSSLVTLQDWLSRIGGTVTELKEDYKNREFFKTEMAERLNSETIKTRLKETEESLETIKGSSQDALTHLQSLVDKIRPIVPRFADFGIKKVSNLNEKLNQTTLQSGAEHLSITLGDNLLLIKHYQGELKEYLDMNKLDGDFFLNNFLQIEVYYQDLSETVMSQHSPYGLIDLACDVGGTMALYLGASILTLFEFFDFLTKALNYCLCRPKQRAPTRTSELPLAS